MTSTDGVLLCLVPKGRIACVYLCLKSFPSRCFLPLGYHVAAWPYKETWFVGPAAGRSRLPLLHDLSVLVNNVLPLCEWSCV